jgi:hypothetical protein
MLPTSVRGILVIAVALLVLPGFGRADSLDDARANVAKIKANISTANKEISDRNGRIIAADIAIALNETAINDAVKNGKTDQELALRLVLVGLKAAKDKLVREKQQWEQYLQKHQAFLPVWEAEVKRLGG